MSVTFLGQIGYVESSGSSVDVVTTVDVPASDWLIDRLVTVWVISATNAVSASSFSDAVDDAPLVPPNVCYGANFYEGQGPILFAGGSTSGTNQVFSAAAWQPLPAGTTITVSTGGDPCDWMRAYAYAYEGPKVAAGSFTWYKNYLVTTGPVAGCYTSNWSVPSGVAWGFGVIGEFFTPSVSSLTFKEAVTVRDTFYDVGPCNVSGRYADIDFTGGTFDIAGCSDIPSPSSDVFINGGYGFYQEGGGLQPCGGDIIGRVYFEQTT